MCFYFYTPLYILYFYILKLECELDIEFYTFTPLSGL